MKLSHERYSLLYYVLFAWSVLTWADMLVALINRDHTRLMAEAALQYCFQQERMKERQS